MARKAKTTPRRRTKKKSNSSKYDSALNNLGGIIIVLMAVLGLFNLGALGTLFANFFRVIGGQTYPVLLIIMGLYGLGMALKGRWPRFKLRYIIGFLIAYVGVLLLFHGAMFEQLNRHTDFASVTWSNLNSDIMAGSISMPVGGGMVGAYLYQLSYFLVSALGTTMIAWLFVLIGVVVFFNIPITKILASFEKWAKQLGMWVSSLKDQQTPRQEMPEKPKKSLRERREKRSASRREKREQKAAKNVPNFFDEGENNVTTPVETSVEPQKQVEPKITVASDSESNNNDDDQVVMKPAQESENEDYQLPSTALLTKVDKADQSKELNDIKKNTQTLQDTLASFGVDAQVENVSLGPSVTKYELRPAVGVKVSRIVHLADDLALALAAKDIRIEAPIPGKSMIGIEVPNRQVATVGFRDMVESAPKNNKVLEVPLGRAVTGQVVMADLTKMPHLLVAGATGSGKSVAINVMITSILLKAKPHQVKFLMIDPKKVELSVYNGIPHLLSPVVSQPKKAAKALGKVVGEMERRYELFAGFGVRNIDGYNKMVKQENEKSGNNDPYLPLILVIVDELADLMMTVSNDVEDAIVRIAQMGRAAGIHMILATQRPSVDVITGLIKANVPSRVAFAVSSGIDSRTILDTNGAEKLLGRGDMLFMPIDQNKPVRVQGAFISDKDVESVVDFIKKQQTAEYDENIVVSDEEIQQDENKEDEDDLYQEAVDFVIDQQKASTSLIQRRFRIGYNRAARMIDEMEQRGLIGPAEGSKPRQVYKEKND
ncbi:DNA translocase FtsK [Paucilactobacillus suebicus]|uniref:DNA translocase FtsK n=1 Tax=Paucilactobacillus suebicus TaxID=152335 RepID=UPI0002490D39|nr:DNA translocase FtsK [Paucilactobacillus suebicus]